MKGLILTYIAAYGGAAVALFNPLVGLFVYAAFGVMRPQAIFAFAGSAANQSLVVGVCMILGWLGKGGGDWNFGRARGIVVAMGGYMTWYAISGIFSPNLDGAWHALIDRSKELLIPFLVGITLLSTKEQVRRYTWLIVLCQGYVALEMNQNYYLKGYNLAQDSGLFGAMDNNSFAVSMVTTIGPAVVLSLSERKWWLKGLGLVSAVLMINTTFLTFSRGGMLALVISGVMVFLFLPKRPVHALGYVVVLLLAIRLAGPQVRVRFMSAFADKQRDASSESRISLWTDCLTVVARDPLTGVGPRRWPVVAPEFGWPPGKQAHSLWMQSAAELGIPGVGFLLLFYGTAMSKSVRLRLDRTDEWNRTAAQVVITGLTGFIVAAQFVSLEGLEVPFHLVLVCAATLKIASREAPAAVAVTSPAATPLRAANAMRESAPMRGNRT